MIFSIFLFRLQDVDDSFFEKFGSLLRQKSQLDENIFKTSLAPYHEEEEDVITKVDAGSYADTAVETKNYDNAVLGSVPDSLFVENIRDNFFDTTICMNVSKLDLYNVILLYFLQVQNEYKIRFYAKTIS